MGTLEDGGVMKHEPTDVGSPVQLTPERDSELVNHDHEPICASDHLSAKISELKRCGFRVELYHSAPNHAPSGKKICDVPSESRTTFPADPTGNDCPADAFPIVERLVATASGAGGKFVVCGFGESRPEFTPLTPHIVHVDNNGEPKSIYWKLGAAICQITTTPGMNCYIMPCLVRSDLPEGQRGKESDVLGVLAIALDFDAGHDPANRHDRIAVDPISEVETSPGNFQCWWFLDRPYSVAEAKPVIAAFVNTSSSDPMCKSAEHPFRVPGLLNWPTQKKIGGGRSAGEAHL
jgi:DNA primase RepB-like protein